MIDGRINESKDSRLIKADLPATYEQFRALAAGDGIPIDLLINLLGWAQIPTWLNKASLLDDTTAAATGNSETVNQAIYYNALMGADLQRRKKEFSTFELLQRGLI